MSRRAGLVLALTACASPPSAPLAPPVAAPAADSTDRVPFSSDDRAAELAFLRDAIRDTYAHLEGPTRTLRDTLAPLVAQIFAAPHGLVVDLRGDDGGFEDNARALAAQLVTGDVTGGSTRVRLSQRAREAHRAWKSLAEDPDRIGWSVAQPLTVHGAAAAPYPADLAVVIDAGCRSSCETLALLLHEAGGRLIGERTGGASGAPVTVVLPMSKATVTLPARAMYDPHGDPIEGRGVAPDDEVTDDRAAIATGHDRALEAAIAWACQRQPASCP